MAGEEGPGEGEVTAARGEGAVVVVVVQDGVDGVVEVAVAGDEVGQGGVAVAVERFGRGDGGVGAEAGVAGFGAEEVADGAGGVTGEGLEAVGDDDGPGVDEGVAGMPCSASNWRSELKGLPDGSRPTRFQTSSVRASTRQSVKSLEMLWTEKGCSQSPTP